MIIPFSGGCGCGALRCECAAVPVFSRELSLLGSLLEGRLTMS